MTTETMTTPDIDTGAWTLDRAHTKVGFVAKHLMVTKVRGHFEEFDATIEVTDDLTDSSIEVTLDAATITTGAMDRDEHLRSADFLDVESHPTLRFVSTDITRDGDEWRITGDLTIRDVTRPVTLIAEYEGTAIDPWGNTRIGFSARAHMQREDWGLTWNAALEGGGWLVSKDVTLEIEGQLVRPQ
ncbi:MAG TPA: YceI family protein [Acidimicrobiia bacterium]|nr:YceI family protein [Acidimicrobiia bacterium]